MTNFCFCLFYRSIFFFIQSLYLYNTQTEKYFSFKNIDILQLLKDSDTYLDYLCNWELLAWSLALGVYILRFMTLGLKINQKYRNLSVLITEQVRKLYLLDLRFTVLNYPFFFPDLAAFSNLCSLVEFWFFTKMSSLLFINFCI